MNIEQFRNKLGAGGVRPNQFLVTLPVIAGIGAPSDTAILVTAAALPASNVNPTIIAYRGREVKLAGERIFDPWTVTIVNDTAMTLRKYFEEWSNLMNDRASNMGQIVPALYLYDLTVAQLDRNDAVLRTYNLRGAFPNTVSEIALAYGQNDTISEFTVTFQYQYFDVV